MKLIAFYLPQFHEIPENNAFWGKGFTEWNHIQKNIDPLFIHHHRVGLPTELGFYNLENNEVRHAQAKLAQTYGIDAWCYYYYRFNGKRVLEKPLNKHFEDKSLSMPFLICWANENWTRAWDGSEKEVLIEQTHNTEDDLNFIEEMSPMLLDERYFKVNNKPVILIYRTDMWKNIKSTTEVWRDFMRKKFNKEIYLIKCHTWKSNQNPYELGFDAAYQFPPHLMELYFISKEKYTIANYLQWVNFVKISPDFKLFRGVMTGFDNTPRKKENGFVFLGSSPTSYGEWLKEAINYTKKYFQKEEQMIFINAWNEWGEGAVLEPSSYWGRSYLDATLKCKQNIEQKLFN
jgi:lipopolysaccharide biosynthesis protein